VSPFFPEFYEADIFFIDFFGSEVAREFGLSTPGFEYSTRHCPQLFFCGWIAYWISNAVEEAHLL
jgi:hypothetical protein